MVGGMETVVATVSGYHGAQRSKLIRLIDSAGANYVGKMSKSITHLVCWKFKGKKYELANKFGTLVVNHRWLEDCIKEGKRVPEQPYTLQSGQEAGLIVNPIATKGPSLLSENTLLLNQPFMLDRYKDVLDLDSDEIENDGWDDDWLLDEKLFPRPGSSKTVRQKSTKRVIIKNTRAKAKNRRSIDVPEIDIVDILESDDSDYLPECSHKNRRDIDICMGTVESSRRNRRLVRKSAATDQSESTANSTENQSRTLADTNECPSATSPSNESNELREEIGVSFSSRPESPSVEHDKSRDEVNHISDLRDASLQSDEALGTTGQKSPELSPTVQNFNRCHAERNLVDHSTGRREPLELSCVICWTDFSPTRGVLPCGHRFCFSCIQNWADHMASERKDSKCPLCKESFTVITRVEDAASLDQKIYSQTIPCALSSQDLFIVPEGRAIRSNEVRLPFACCHCQSPYPTDLLIYCHMCQDSCIHSYCLDPPLYPWTCNTCRDRRQLYHY